MKKYWYVWISLCSGEKIIQDVVKDWAFYCTEERLHEITFSILKNMEKEKMTFNGKNSQRYFELFSRKAPAPDKIGEEIKKLQKKVR